MYLFVAVALGFLAIGQTVAVAAKLGAFDYIGTVMVTVIVRELGPLMAAVLALARVGAANVIELGTARALGKVEALEAAGIDPVHYLVVPQSDWNDTGGFFADGIFDPRGAGAADICLFSCKMCR